LPGGDILVLILLWYLLAIAGSDFDQLTVHLGKKIVFSAIFFAFFSTFSIQNGIKMSEGKIYL
jgi:hypothetical protein